MGILFTETFIQSLTSILTNHPGSLAGITIIIARVPALTQLILVTLSKKTPFLFELILTISPVTWHLTSSITNSPPGAFPNREFVVGLPPR